MKTITRTCLRAVILGGLLATAGITTASAQATTTESTTTTTSSAGTISQFSPDAMTITTTTSPAPVSYSFSKTTTYVDESGNPVSVDVVKSGVPVTVYYTQDGDRMVASKVIVRKTVMTDPAPAPAVMEEKKSSTTTTTTSSGQ